MGEGLGMLEELKQWSREREMMDEVVQVIRAQTMRTLRGHAKKCGHYSKHNKKALRGSGRWCHDRT